MLPTALGDDEKRVCKIQNLGQIENIQHETDRWVDVLERLARHERVASFPCLYPCLDAHVGTQHDLADIVQEFKSIESADFGANSWICVCV